MAPPDPKKPRIVAKRRRHRWTLAPIDQADPQSRQGNQTWSQVARVDEDKSGVEQSKDKADHHQRPGSGYLSLVKNARGYCLDSLHRSFSKSLFA